jgi:ribonuclease HI
VASKHRIAALPTPVEADNSSVAELSLFTDGSINPLSKIGYGAYLVATTPLPPCDQLTGRAVSKRFTETTSTRLEIQTLLWAIHELKDTGQLQTQRDHLTVYTDCQTIINLPTRRQRLEQNNYCSKKNIPLKNGDLYQQLFRQFDLTNLKLIKVRGHQSTKNKKHLDQIFTLVDRHARQALRAEQAK